MTIKNLLLFFCVFTAISWTNAQSGYLGKRLIGRYNFYGNFALNNPTYNQPVGLRIDDYSDDGYAYDYEDGEAPSTGWNSFHGFELEYITSRKGSWTFLYGYSRTSIDHQQRVINTTSNNSSYDDDDVYFLHNPYDLNFKLHSHEYGIKYTSYLTNRAGIAPLGLYLSYGFSVLANSVVYRKLVNEKYKKDKIHNFTSTAFTFEIGKQKVFFDKIIVNIGISTRYTFGTDVITGIVNSDYSVDSDYDGDYYYYNASADEEQYTETARLERNAKRRLFMKQLFNLKFGVGYLIK